MQPPGCHPRQTTTDNLLDIGIIWKPSQGRIQSAQHPKAAIGGNFICYCLETSISISVTNFELFLVVQ